MTKPITAIIFDFGNVLVKWDARNLYKRFLPDLGSVDSFLEEIRFHDWNARLDAGYPFKEGVAELCEQFPHYSGLIQAYDTYWEESVTEPIDESIRILRALKKAGWNLYLLSNFSVDKFKLMQNRFDFLGCFDDMIISGEHGIAKPHPAIFELALKRIKRKAQECLFIDDSMPNIQTAGKLGFHVIHFQTPEQLRADLGLYSITGI